MARHLATAFLLALLSLPPAAAAPRLAFPELSCGQPPALPETQPSCASTAREILRGNMDVPDALLDPHQRYVEVPGLRPLSEKELQSRDLCVAGELRKLRADWGWARTFCADSERFLACLISLDRLFSADSELAPLTVEAIENVPWISNLSRKWERRHPELLARETPELRAELAALFRKCPADRPLGTADLPYFKGDIRKLLGPQQAAWFPMNDGVWSCQAAWDLLRLARGTPRGLAAVSEAIRTDLAELETPAFRAAAFPADGKLTEPAEANPLRPRLNGIRAGCNAGKETTAASMERLFGKDRPDPALLRANEEMARAFDGAKEQLKGFFSKEFRLEKSPASGAPSRSYLQDTQSAKDFLRAVDALAYYNPATRTPALTDEETYMYQQLFLYAGTPVSMDRAVVVPADSLRWFSAKPSRALAARFVIFHEASHSLDDRALDQAVARNSDPNGPLATYLNFCAENRGASIATRKEDMADFLAFKMLGELPESEFTEEAVAELLALFRSPVSWPDAKQHGREERRVERMISMVPRLYRKLGCQPSLTCEAVFSDGRRSD
jgi:hypothetical protein